MRVGGGENGDSGGVVRFGLKNEPGVTRASSTRTFRVHVSGAALAVAPDARGDQVRRVEHGAAGVKLQQVIDGRRTTGAPMANVAVTLEHDRADLAPPATTDRVSCHVSMPTMRPQ